MARRVEGVDLDLVQCVDFMHQYEYSDDQAVDNHAVYMIAETGPLTGLAVRVLTCKLCFCQLRQHLGWNGKVEASAFDDDDNRRLYLEEARKLSDDMHERRTRYRELRIAHLQPAKARRLKSA